jgi:mercuric ion transport protein
VLALASASALVASTCCLLPLVLVTLGVTGAWITALHYSPPLSAGLALFSATLLVWLWVRFFRRGTTEARAACDAPGTGMRVLFWLTAGLAALMLTSPVWAPLFY